MNSYAGLCMGAGGGQPLPKAPWTPQSNSPPCIPAFDDLPVPGALAEQYRLAGLPSCFPPPGLGEEFATKNNSKQAPVAQFPPGLVEESPQMSASPLPLLLGRTRTSGYEKSMKKGFDRGRGPPPPPGCGPPPGLFSTNVAAAESLPQRLDEATTWSRQSLGGEHAEITPDQQQLLAVLNELQSLRLLSSQLGAHNIQARPHCQSPPGSFHQQQVPPGFSQHAMPTRSPMPQLLSTGAPGAVCDATPYPFVPPGPPPPPSVLTAAVAGFSSGLPGAATVAAALSSAAHGLQAPKRQHPIERSDVPYKESFGGIDFGPADVAAGVGHLRGSGTGLSPVPNDVERSTAASSPSALGDRKSSHGEKESPSFGFDTDTDGQSKNGRRFGCKFVFVGIDLDRDQDFEIVPRLIGRGGENMRQIAQRCNGKVRIRGRGSGHKEQQKGGKVAMEADVPLQIALSCKDRRSFEEGKQILITFLEGMCAHFERYCKRHRIDPVPALYTIVGDP